MFPIRDDQPRFSTPYVTYFLIGLNLAIFLFEFSLDPASLDSLIRQFGMIPEHVTLVLTRSHNINFVALVLPFFTSMFLHGSWSHVIGNMWFLWIFGDNIEDYLGHFKYIVFYVLCGLAAAVAQFVVTPNLSAPTVGASGAIAGVMGAYLILYPRAKVLTWLFVLVFYVPAWVMLGYWFVLQFLSGTATTIAPASQRGPGVAFWAHVGGFIAGIVLIKIFPERAQRRRYGTW
jgi:membrane associated rhomboid family serine protease